MAETLGGGARRPQARGVPSLISSLRDYAEAEPQPRAPEEVEAETAELLEDLLDQELARRAQAKGQIIPTFFKPKPSPASTVNRVQKLALMRKEQIKSEEALDEEQVKALWALIEEFAIHDNDDVKINYDGYCQVATRCRELVGAHVASFFKASTFAMFEQDRDGCISASHFATYLQMRSNMLQLRVQLAAFDDARSGVLNEQQLEAFIGSKVAELPPLGEMEASFSTSYRRIAARKFLLFHGRPAGANANTGQTVRIRDMVTSLILQEMLELRNAALEDSQLIANWFSLQSTRRVHNTFQALDEDMNGMLSRSEFSQISNGTMSPLFIKRIFEEHVMKRRPMTRHIPRDEMDLISFTDFVLAWDHRSHPAAIKYFFPIFDLSNKGRITPADIYTFFKEIHVMWVDMGEYADLAIYDVVDELLDMIKPKKGPEISADDLRESGMSGVFFSILSDVKQFYDYNYRENFMHQDDDN